MRAVVARMGPVDMLPTDAAVWFLPALPHLNSPKVDPLGRALNARQSPQPMPVAAACPGAAIAKIARCILGARQKADHPIDCGHSSRADCAWFLNCDGVILRALTKARVKEGTEL